MKYYVKYKLMGKSVSINFFSFLWRTYSTNVGILTLPSNYIKLSAINGLFGLRNGLQAICKLLIIKNVHFLSEKRFWKKSEFTLPYNLNIIYRYGVRIVNHQLNINANFNEEDENKYRSSFFKLFIFM